MQRQAAAAIWGGSDALIHAATGSGKTLAFLLPLLAQLSYPPDTYPEDLKVSSELAWLGSELLLRPNCQSHCRQGVTGSCVHHMP